MVTAKVVSVLVFWIMIGWTAEANAKHLQPTPSDVASGIKRSALSHSSPFSNSNTINGSPRKYVSGGGRAPNYFAFPNQNGTNPSNNFGGGSLGHDVNNTVGNPGSGSLGKDVVGNLEVTNSSFSINAPGNSLTDSVLQNPASIIEVPPNNDSSGHPYLNRPQVALSLPLNPTSNIVSGNTTKVNPLQPNSSGNYGTTTSPNNNGGNPSSNFLQQIGDGIKFAQDVTQNISTSAGNTFIHWLQGLPNPTQNGNSRPNTSQTGGFSYQLHWPGGNWSFEIPGNKVSRLAVGGSLNGSGFFEAQARNNTSRGQAPRKIVGADNSETGIKEGEHHGIHSNTKNHSGRRKFNKNKQRHAYEEEEHKALRKVRN